MCVRLMVFEGLRCAGLLVFDRLVCDSLMVLGWRVLVY